MNTVTPESHLDLLTRPLFAHLATIRPDGTPQVNPMWFSWDGTHLRFTGTTTRYKYRNIAQHPTVALSINDPQQPYRYLEIRGVVTSIEPDRDGTFFLSLANRYELPVDGPPSDAADRIVYLVEPRTASYQ